MSATFCRSGDREKRTGWEPPGPWRLAGLAVVVLLGVGLIGWLLHSTWTRLEQVQRDFAAMEAESFYLGLRIRSQFEHLNASLLRYRLSKSDPAERDRFRADALALSGELARTKPLLATPDERGLADEIEAAFATYLERAAPLIETSLRAIRRESVSEVSDEIRGLSAPVRELCERLIRAQEVSWNGFLEESHRAVGGLWRASVVTMLLLVGFAAAASVLACRAAVGPLRRMLTATRTRLERQEKLAALGTLAAGVAHEIRNPLASLKFRLFSLRESMPPEFARHEDVLVIDDEINRLERIIKDFLQFARPSEPVFESVMADAMIERVGQLLRPALGARGVSVVLEPGESIPLRVDRQQIEQALINLAQNAADSMDTGGGTVTLRARQGAARFGGRSGPAAILEVVDTGRGIPPEARERLFDPFFSTKPDGSGLGLPISERIIEKHGGFIQYQTQLNRGTTFQIVLPCDPAHARQDTHR